MKPFTPIIHKQRRPEVADGSAKCCGHISACILSFTGDISCHPQNIPFEVASVSILI